LLVPRLGENLARQHEVHRAGRLALHDRVRASQDLLAGDARRQCVFPLHIGPYEAALIERLLDEVHIGVARPFQLAEARERRRAGDQQDRHPIAEQVVHAERRIGGARVHVDQYGLALSRHLRVPAGHVDGHVLVWAQHDLRRLEAVRVEASELFDQRRMIGAEIAEQVLDIDLFEKIMRC
jgi:hypothetical protein